MTSRARFVCLAFLVALLGNAQAAHAQEPAAPLASWDQARVTTLAGELSVAVKDLRDAERNTGRRSVASMQSRKQHQFADKLRLIQSESRHLASELAEGQGLDATLPVYRHLRLLIRDARELAQRLFIQIPVQNKIDAGRQKLDALAAYYPPEV